MISTPLIDQLRIEFKELALKLISNEVVSRDMWLSISGTAADNISLVNKLIYLRQRILQACYFQLWSLGKLMTIQ